MSNTTQNAPELRSERGERLDRITVEPDQVVFLEGEDSKDTYVIESGSIGVFKTVDGKSVKLATLTKGSVFGEMAAVTGAKRSATTMALETSVLVKMSGEIVQNRLANCDPFIRALINILINNLGRINERFAMQHSVADQLLNDLQQGAAAGVPKTNAA